MEVVSYTLEGRIGRAPRGNDLANARWITDSIEKVMALHRHAEAYITLGHKDKDGQLRHTDSFRAGFFANLFPDFADECLQDGFVSVNAAIAAGREGAPLRAHSVVMFEPRHTKPVRRGRSFHRETYMRRLNACYCDLDGYKYGHNPESMYSELQRAVESGELPMYSMVQYSGRGLWVFWFLHDPKDPSRSHLGAQPDVLVLYKR